MDDAKARALIDKSYPVYYITGTIHSPETGAPTALMEMAYRLAVDDSPYIKYIRSHMIVLITPVVEVDGRDRMVDIYRWHKAHPNEKWPHLVYWGHYVAHDNNRDAMGMTLDLTRNVLDTYLELARAGAARSARVGARSSTTTRWAMAPTTHGSIRRWPTSGPSWAGTTWRRCRTSACPASLPTATSTRGVPAT